MLCAATALVSATAAAVAIKVSSSFLTANSPCTSIDVMMAKPLSGKSLVAVARCKGAGHLAIGAGSTAPADLSSEAARCLSE